MLLWIKVFAKNHSKNPPMSKNVPYKFLQSYWSRGFVKRWGQVIFIIHPLIQTCITGSLELSENCLFAESNKGAYASLSLCQSTSLVLYRDKSSKLPPSAPPSLFIQIQTLLLLPTGMWCSWEHRLIKDLLERPVKQTLNKQKNEEAGRERQKKWYYNDIWHGTRTEKNTPDSFVRKTDLPACLPLRPINLLVNRMIKYHKCISGLLHFVGWHRAIVYRWSVT